MLEDFFIELKEYAENTSYVESILIVGSYARGTSKESSDLDIVIITSNKSEMIVNQDLLSGGYRLMVDQKCYFENLQL